MHHLKNLVVSLIMGLGLALSSSGIAETAPQAAQDQAAMQKYNEQLTEALLAEGTPRSTVLAATSMVYADKGSRSAIDERRRELLDRAAQMAPDDAWVQWMAAMSRQPADTLSAPALALQRLEPDNGAVWLFQLQVATRAKDNKGITDALERIAASSHFDEYFTATAFEWRKFLLGFPLPEPGVVANAGKLTTEQMAMIAAIARAAATAMPSYSSPISACKSKEQPLTADRREACLAAGRLILNESNTLMSRQIGVALLRLAEADDAAEINRNTKYFMEEYSLASIAELEDPDKFERWQADWLQTGNEIQAARNMLIRAGIPLLPPADWQPAPNPYTTDAGKAKVD